jgi:hypothetical protein
MQVRILRAGGQKRAQGIFEHRTFLLGQDASGASPMRPTGAH